MKRISLFIAGLAFGLAINSGLAPSFTTPAHAQAINHAAILSTLREMQGDISDMINLLERHKAATVIVGSKEFALPVETVDAMKAEYLAAKARLVIKFQSLP